MFHHLLLCLAFNGTYFLVYIYLLFVVLQFLMFTFYMNVTCLFLESAYCKYRVTLLSMVEHNTITENLI